MIQQVLNRRLLEDFLAGMQSETAATLQTPRRRAAAKTPLDDFSESAIRGLLGEIREAKRDLTVPARTDAQQRASPRAAKTLSVSDRKAYIPQSPVLSNLQSAIEEYFHT